jgi:hypothetical protein
MAERRLNSENKIAQKVQQGTGCWVNEEAIDEEVLVGDMFCKTTRF